MKSKKKFKKHGKHGDSPEAGSDKTSLLSQKSGSTKVSFATSVGSHNGTEKKSSSSSAGSGMPRSFLRAMPDFRMFKLAKELKRLKKIEEARLLEENAKWKGGQGPVDPNDEPELANAALSSEDHVNTPRPTPKSPHMDIQGFFHMRRRKDVKDSSGSSTVAASQQDSCRSSIINLDRRKSIVDIPTKPTRQLSFSISPTADFGFRAQKKPQIRTTSSPGHGAQKGKRSAESSKSIPIPRPTFWQHEPQRQSETEVAAYGQDHRSESNAKPRRWSKATQNQGSQEQPSTSPSDMSGKAQKRKRPGLRFSLSDVQPMWPLRKKKDTSESETPSGLTDINTPAHFSRRKAVQVEDSNSSPTYFSGVHPQSPMSPSRPSQRHSSSPRGDVRLPTPPLFHMNRGIKHRGYFGDSIVSSGSDDMSGGTPRTERPSPSYNERPSPSRVSSTKDWYQVRMDDIIQDVGFDHTSVARNAIRDIPEHLPNSPLCPRNPKHPSGGRGQCFWHGQMSPSINRSVQLSL